MSDDMTITDFYPSPQGYNTGPPAASFYQPFRHDELLRLVGRSLPFEPIDPRDTVWKCAKCGSARRFNHVVIQELHGGGTLVLTPSADERTYDVKPTRCGNVTWLQRFKVTHHNWYSKATVEERVCGPRESKPAGDRVDLLREGPGSCESTSWEWGLYDEACRQIRFLYLLPAWSAARAANVNALPFPEEWLQGDHALVVAHARISRLESAVREIVARMSSAGHTLSFGI